MKTIFIFFAIFLLSFFANAEVTVGKKIPNFEAQDINGEKISLERLQGKFVVVEWFHPLCPFTGKHYKSHNMQNLQKEFKEKNVVWISVQTDTRDISESDQLKSIMTWKELTSSSATYYLKLFSAKVTPHMFIINGEGILIYQGGIDNKPSTKVEDVADANNYVSAALNETISGKPISISTTKPYGCPVKY